MTTERGWVEPVDASELTAQHDEIEHWLRDIRTDLADNPPDWLDTTAGSDAVSIDTVSTDAVSTDAVSTDTVSTDAASGDTADVLPDGTVSEDGPEWPATSGDGDAGSQRPGVEHVGRHRAED